MTAISSKPLALTMGDPAGLGPDVTLAAWLLRDQRQLPPFAVFACPECLSARAARLRLEVPLIDIDHPEEASSRFAQALPVIPIPLKANATPGTPDAANATAIVASIDSAVTATIEGRAAAVVTNPIAKSVLYKAGFSQPGHTEYLAALAEQASPGSRYSPVMMLASDELRVVPLTIHVPLATVPTAIQPQLIETTLRILHNALETDFGLTKPRIAVAGLNPHAGEDGSLGREEIEIITPALDRLRMEGFAISGPLPADTMFHAAARQRFDAALAMYHDQALIPIKTLAFDRGVNVTLGLPFVRTSPDHGTAFDIAGSGTASPESLIQALQLAAVMAARRALAETP